MTLTPNSGISVPGVLYCRSSNKSRDLMLDTGHVIKNGVPLHLECVDLRTENRGSVSNFYVIRRSKIRSW